MYWGKNKVLEKWIDGSSGVDKQHTSEFCSGLVSEHLPKREKKNVYHIQRNGFMIQNELQLKWEFRPSTDFLELEQASVTAKSHPIFSERKY